MAKLPAVNNSKVVSASEAERQKILSEANDEFRDAYTKIVDKLAKEGSSLIESRWYIGEMLENMRLDEMTYGAKCIERMQATVDYDRCVIYQALSFFSRYTKKEMQDLIAARTKSGHPLLWTHVTHLTRISDANTREEITNVILDGNLSPAETLNYIQKREGANTRPGSNAGKPLARPKSMLGFIDQQFAVLDQVLRRKNKVWAGSEKPGDKSFFDVVKETPSEKIDSNLIKRVQALKEKYEQTAIEMDSMASEIHKVVKYVQKLKGTAPNIELGEAPGLTNKASDEDDDDEPAIKRPAIRKMEPVL